MAAGRPTSRWAAQPVTCNELRPGRHLPGHAHLEEMQRIILQRRQRHGEYDQAQAEGVRSLRQSGLRKVRLGVTSLEEVRERTND